MIERSKKRGFFCDECSRYSPSAICLRNGYPPLAICQLPFIISGVSRVSALYRLQRVDLDIDQHQTKLTAIHAKLANSPEVQQAGAQLEAAREVLASERKKAKALDDENKSLTAKIAQEEERLYSGKVKNTREMSDLQHEIATLKSKREKMDEAQLTAMDAVEGAEKIEAAARQSLTKVETSRAAEQADLLKERDHLNSLISEFQEARASSISAITADDLSIYESLRKRKRGVAIVELMNSTCKGCGESQSSSKVQIVKQEAELVRCANCERILFAGQEAGYTKSEGGDDDMITRW